MPKVEWRCASGYVLVEWFIFHRPSGQLGKIAFLNWAFVIDVSAKVSTIDSVPVLRDFLDVFLVAGHVPGRG